MLLLATDASKKFAKLDPNDFLTKYFDWRFRRWITKSFWFQLQCIKSFRIKTITLPFSFSSLIQEIQIWFVFSRSKWVWSIRKRIIKVGFVSSTKFSTISRTFSFRSGSAASKHSNKSKSGSKQTFRQQFSWLKVIGKWHTFFKKKWQWIARIKGSKRGLRFLNGLEDLAATCKHRMPQVLVRVANVKYFWFWLKWCTEESGCCEKDQVDWHR